MSLMSSTLDKRLTFYRVIRAYNDGQGGTSKVASLLGTVWGKIDPQFGESEVLMNRKITVYQGLRAKTRQLLDFTPNEKDIIALNGRQYLIMGLQNVGLKGVMIKYSLRELDTQEFVDLSSAGIFNQNGDGVFNQTGNGIFNQVGA